MMVRKIAFPLFALASIFSVTALSCRAVSYRPSPAASEPTVGITPSLVLPGVTPTGYVINTTPNGGAQLVDYDGGYTIDIPSEWFVTGVDPAAVKESIAKIAEDDPELAQAIKTAQEKAPASFRLIAFDKNHSHYVKGYAPNFNVGVFRDTMAVTAPMEFLIQGSVENMETQVPGLKIKQLGIQPNVHNVLVGATESEFSSSSTRDPIGLYQKDLFFQTKKALVVITFFTPQTSANETQPLFDRIRDGIQLLES